MAHMVSKVESGRQLRSIRKPYPTALTCARPGPRVPIAEQNAELSGMVWRSRSIPLPEPASLTNSLKICERCRLEELFAGNSID
jgi:hypothetical protein